MTTRMTTSYRARAAWLAAGLATAPIVWAGAQGFSEPHTVFYGKVVGTASAQPFLITEGQLSWTITRADGTALTLRTSLFAFHGNTYSYRLDVPHSAFALGLPSEPNRIPMPPVPQVHVHTSVKVDGVATTLLGPAPSSFTTEQLLRTSTYRLDLGIARQAVDTDGDGIPDWWEDAYGLDKQDPSDAGRDSNGDGVSALAAYLRGLDPAHDVRVPTLLTRELIVYPSGTTGLLLDVVDVDSTPEQLVYTLTGLPVAGTVSLRNANATPAAPDLVLDIGGQFTHADLLRGRVVYDPDPSASAPGSLALSLRDQDPAHPACEAEVLLLPFVPGSTPSATLTDLEAQRLLNHSHAARGFVVLDASVLPSDAQVASPSTGLSAAALAAYQTAYGDDRRALLVGGGGSAWSLAGGHRADVLVAGSGSGTLHGGGGNDVFTARFFAAGRVVVADFSVAEADVLDLSRMPVVPGASVHSYLSLVAVSDGYELRTALAGTGVGYTNLVVALPTLGVADADLYTLIEAGRLRVGDVRLDPRVTVVATEPQAAENGPVVGRFTITRQGSLTEELTVNLLLTGTALNGVDYAYVPSVVTLPADVASVDVAIVPIADGVTEPVETVQLVLSSGPGYRLGVASQATVTIEDLRMLVSIEALEPLAVKDTLSSGVLVVTRSDVIHRDVLVRLDIGGTASNGSDYQSLPSYVYLSVNQTVAFVYVTPKASATLVGGSETVNVTVRSDAAYLVSGPRMAQVAIIERMDSFADWSAREFGVGASSLASFAKDDAGGKGLSNFQRYAFGLDPIHPSKDGLPQVFVYQGRLVVTFRKPLGRNDLRYIITGMTDLRNRWGSQKAMSSIAAPDGSTDPQRVYYQIAPDAANAASAFVEVKAEWVP